MKKLKIEIIKLGESKYNPIIKKMQKISRKSKLFEITEIKKVNLPDSDDFSWGYSDKQLLSLIQKSNTKADIRLGIIDYPIEDNFFGRHLSDTVGVMTFYQTDKIFKEANLDLLNFVLSTIYQAIILFSCNSSILQGESPYHNEARGCLFDMCGIKEDIVIKASKPSLCHDCEAMMRKKLLNENFISQLKREFKFIKKPLFYRIFDWVKAHPVLSLVITVLSTIIINLVSNAFFELIKCFLEMEKPQ